MRLSDILDQLKYGELSEISIGGNSEGVLDPYNLPIIITHVNLGLIELYKRFSILTKTATIQTVPHINRYYLDSKYAFTNPQSTDDIAYPKYLIDSSFDPFLDDVLVVEEITDEVDTLISLNDENDPDSILAVGHNIIDVPNPGLEATIFVHYRAAPISIDKNTVLDPANIEIPLNPQYLEAMLNYIAHRAFAAINMNNPEATSYYQKFLASCNLITQEGLRNKLAPSNLKLQNNGWV